MSGGRGVLHAALLAAPLLAAACSGGSGGEGRAGGSTPAGDLEPSASTTAAGVSDEPTATGPVAVRSPEPDLATAARRALDELRALAAAVPEDWPAAPGVPQSRRLARATLGPPLREVLVGLEALQAAVADEDPELVLAGSEHRHYLVRDGEEAIGAIELVLIPGGWSLAAFGRLEHATALEQVSTAMTRRNATPGHAPFVLAVPALTRALAVEREDGRLFLTPVDRRRPGALPNPVPAEITLGELGSEAVGHDGRPG